MPTLADIEEAFVACSRPILECYILVGSAYVKKDNQVIEEVQRCFTKAAFKRAFHAPFEPNYEQPN